MMNTKKEIVYKEKNTHFIPSQTGTIFLKMNGRFLRKKKPHRSEWISEIEAEILNAEPELKQDNPTELSNRVETIFLKKKYAEYLKP
ncbi:MAG: hypothetical protein L6V90_08265 [Treponema succinifaciens]|nr:MAG: hypothetical protein L6V90_08265 [Treponema succinifaciens]